MITNLFLSHYLKKKNFSIYWNKTYEPNYLQFDNYLAKNFKSKGINFKICKGNILNELDVKKTDGTPFKVFTPFWRVAEEIYLKKVPSRDAQLKKKNKKIFIFKESDDLKKDSRKMCV